MRCPHCQFRFHALMANTDKVPELAPLVCSQCAKVSFIINGTDTRIPTAEELEEIKLSPAWELVIKMVEIAERNVRSMNRARNN